ncbi:MAG TPA: hypothetical protein VIE66_11745 [Methylocella sp.]|jgi:hypothetical protein
MLLDYLACGVSRYENEASKAERQPEAALLNDLNHLLSRATPVIDELAKVRDEG